MRSKLWEVWKIQTANMDTLGTIHNRERQRVDRAFERSWK